MDEPTKAILRRIANSSYSSTEYHEGIIAGIAVSIQLLKNFAGNDLPSEDMTKAIRQATPLQIAHLLLLLHTHNDELNKPVSILEVLRTVTSDITADNQSSH